MWEKIKYSFANQKIIWIGGIIIILLGSLLLVLTFLQRRPTPVVVTNPAVKLTWWSLDYDSETYNSVIEQFRKTPGNSNVEVEVIKKDISNSYYKSLISDLARGIGPDIFALRNDDLPAYKDLVAPIELFRGKALTDYKTNFSPLVVTNTMDKDKVFGITSYVDNLQLFYNKSLLSQNKIPAPARTWEELTRQIPFITKRPINTETFLQSAIALGTGGRNSSQGEPNIPLHRDIIPLLIFQYGGQLYDYQTQSSIFGQGDPNILNNPASDNSGVQGSSIDENSPAYRAIRFYLDFADPSTSRYSWNNRNPKAEEMFLQSKLIYIIQYKSFASEIKTKNERLNFDVTPIPQVDISNKRTYGKFYMNSLNRALTNNKTPENDIKYLKGQEFLQFLTTQDAQALIASKTNMPSSHREVIKSQLEGDQITRTFAEGSLYSENYYKPTVEKSERIWSNLLEQVQYNNVPLSDAIKNSIEEYQNIVTATPELRTQ
jgi:ABC-type glycerol-3-phosphate transport system substrate-binding protein